MNRHTMPNDDSLSPADLERVIAVCDRFEHAWNAGRAPSIEDFQGEVPEHLRGRLVRELLALEIELRQAQGQRPGQDEYRLRFPDQAEWTDAILAESTKIDTWPPRPSSDAGPPDSDDTWSDTPTSGQAEATTESVVINPLSPQDPGLEATSLDCQASTEADPVQAPLDAANPKGGRAGSMFDTPNPSDRTTSVEGNPGTTDGGAAGPPAEETQPITPAPGGSSSWVGKSGYELLEEIGRGGMGIVYKARHRGLKRLVALKVILGGIDARPELLGRLRTEAEAVARLHHENIVQVYDVGEMNGDPFVALELLEGGTLAAKLGGTPQQDRLAATMICTLARAMHAAHEARIVHRDLKPLNVLLDESGRLKIADFGLAKILGEVDQKTLSGVALGTPSYMAPEQAEGRSKEVGPAADIYALGAILYEMLTGRPPFKGPTAHATLLQVIQDEPVPPSRLQPHVSRDLETICLKCLSKDPHRRYTLAADMADDLDRFLEGRPILARRTPFWEQGMKWARRHPTTSTLTALAFAASVALAATWAWYQDHLRQRDRAESARLATRTSEGTSKLLKGQEELARGRLHEAKLTFSNLLTEIQDEPQRLAGLRGRLLALLPQVDAAIARERADADRRVAEAHTRDRYRQFCKERDNALYHETQFTGLDPSLSREACRTSAEAALAIFGAAGSEGNWSLSRFPDSLSEKERHDIEEGCYVLLLILARAEDQPEQSLRLLSAADKLHAPTRAYKWRLADCLASLENVEGAERARREADRLMPVTAFDHFLTGLDSYDRRDWPAAVGHLDAALRLQPNHFWAHALSAVCCLRPELKRPEQAKVHLSACLQDEPALAWLYMLRGFASYQATVLDRGAVKAQPAQGNTKETAAAAAFEPALADYRTAESLLSTTPNAEVQYILLINRSLLWLEQRQWDQAVSDLEAAIRLDGRHYLGYATLAQIYQRQGKPDEAIARFDQAIAVRPDLPALYRGRAEVELSRIAATPDQRGRALADLDRATRLEPPRSPVLARDQANRALLFYLDHRDEKVIEACDAALAIVPDIAEAHLLRVKALLRLRRFRDAVRSCDALLSRGKPSAEVYQLRHLAREGVEDFAGAIEDITQTLALRPGQPTLMARRAELYLIEDSPLLAARDFEAALRLDPSNAVARVGLGAARVRLGRYREALTDAEAAVRIAPANHRVLYKAARIYALAAVAVTSEVRRKGQEAVVTVARYQDRAVALVAAARALVPATERASLEAAVRTDPAVATIRRRLRQSATPAPGARATTVLSPGTDAE